MKTSIFLTLAACAALAACGTPKIEPQVRVVEKRVPVPVPCVSDKLGEAPAYPDTDAALLAAPNAAERFKLLGQGREVRIYRLAELEGVIMACRIVAGSDPPK